MIDLSAYHPMPAPPSAEAIPLAHQIEEIEREIAIKRKTYRYLVTTGQMTQADSDRHLVRMLAVLGTLQRLERGER